MFTKVDFRPKSIVREKSPNVDHVLDYFSRRSSGRTELNSKRSLMREGGLPCLPVTLVVLRGVGGCSFRNYSHSARYLCHPRSGDKWHMRTCTGVRARYVHGCQPLRVQACLRVACTGGSHLRCRSPPAPMFSPGIRESAAKYGIPDSAACLICEQSHSGSGHFRHGERDQE